MLKWPEGKQVTLSQWQVRVVEGSSYQRENCSKCMKQIKGKLVLV